MALPDQQPPLISITGCTKNRPRPVFFIARDRPQLACAQRLQYRLTARSEKLVQQNVERNALCISRYAILLKEGLNPFPSKIAFDASRG